jgi:signal transduction histidine kinase/ActR/RegA family two-component response regulator
LTDVPADYVRINSGLGSSPPLNIIVLPVLFEGSMRAVVELASFSPFSLIHQTFLDQLTESIGLVLNTIEANTITENLLEQSQSQAEELRSQQEDLRESNEDLERQAKLLAAQNIQAEQKNQEVEQSKLLLEEKAGQLAISSKYKSEFIANMSHELRTPLNSLLMLAEQLEDNPGHNMTDTQVEYASVILASGKDLLKLLNSILDLAKVESGTVTLEMTELSIGELRTALLREFEYVAHDKGLTYSINLAPDCPGEIVTDPQRLRQILKNLLANALKFTSRGEVKLEIGLAESGWSSETESLVAAPAVVALSIRDTGVGIEQKQQQRIFEAFAQVEGGTARDFGGTGLGLSISRALVGLLGGEITLLSTPGQGSCFTVYLPLGRPGGTGTTPFTAGLTPPSDAFAVSPRIAKQSPRASPPRVSGIDDHPFDGRKVLVVDDDFRNVFALTALLERGHAEVIPAESGPDALAILQGPVEVDLVLMDIRMPGMDGYTAIRSIRLLAECATLPIVCITSNVTSGERERCMGAGANDYVPKPLDTVQLLAAIGPWLASREESDK